MRRDHLKFQLYWRVWILAGSLFFACPLALRAQQVMAAISGRITDASGATVPGARITATNLEQGLRFTTQSNGHGLYTLPRVPIGDYQVTVSAHGFKTAVHPRFSLQLNQNAQLNFQLVVGSVSQTVQVTAAQPLLQTRSATVGTIIGSRTTNALPLASRNYVQLTLLSAGSVTPNPQHFTSGQSLGIYTGRPYINGNREQANNFILDGMDNNQVDENGVGVSPAPDAIQEFNLITANPSAEFGNFEGGIVSVVLKSGTNHWHGDLYEFLRNDVLNANDWAANWQGAPRSKMRWNQFGGTLGGPILHNKLFVFGDYEGERYDFPASTGAFTVLTPAERAGNFSAVTTQLYDPFCVVANQRMPFPGNNILANPAPGVCPNPAESPAAKALLASSFYPAVVNNNLTQNAFNTSDSHTNVNQEDVKVDGNLSQNDHLFVRVSHAYMSNPSNNSQPLLIGSYANVDVYNEVADWTHTISANFINEMRVGVNWSDNENGNLGSNLGDLAQKLGIQNGNGSGPGLPAIQFSGGSLVTNLGSSNSGGPQQLFANTVIEYEDQMVITHGAHTFHTGFQYWRDRIDIFYSGNNGRAGYFDFNGQYTGPGGASTASGLAEADFMLGLPDSLGLGVQSGTWGQRASILAGYLQDNWQFSPNLTLNLGFRYEDHTPWVEVHNRQANFGLLSGTEYFAGQTNTPYSNNRALYNSYNAGADFQPRLGFEWGLNNRNVLRGSYAISTYLEGTGTNLRLPLNPPFQTEANANYAGTTLPATTLDQGFSKLKSPTDPFAGAVIRLWDPNIQPAVDQQWNLTLQHQFSNSTTWQVGYVGEHVTHLMVPMPYAQLQLLPGGKTAPSIYMAGNPTLVNDIGEISGTATNGNQEYDALQTTFLHRFQNGLQYQLAYTYSKCMTNSSGYFGSWGGETIPTSPYFQNLYNMKAEWGPCYYDLTHSLSAYAVYAMPVGKGKSVNLGSVGNAVLGNWNLSGIVQWHGGFPLTTEGPDNTHTNSRGMRLDCNGPVQYENKPASTGGIQWFSGSTFSNALPGQFGTCSVGDIRGPGMDTLDLSLQREFPFGEGKRIEFRSEFLNFFNTPILGAPAVYGGSSMGQITSSQGARNIQFGLKFYF